MEKGLLGDCQQGWGLGAPPLHPWTGPLLLSKEGTSSYQTDVVLPLPVPSTELASFGIPSEMGITWPQLPVPTFGCSFQCQD